ncbi:MAG: sigma 54-interacting transcriptional regulator [Lachnospiraceae bacterium]|nr:sigma 54-interacting transcriptional regulator [Lachnospiraceae bacterium]
MKTPVDFGIAVLSSAGTILFANDKFFDILELQKAEQLPDDIENLFDIKASSKNQGIKKLTGKNYQGLYYCVQSAKLFKHVVKLILVFDFLNVDILEKNYMNLKEEHSIFRLIVDNLSDGVVLLDKDARIIYCNDAMPRQIGISKEEYIKNTSYDLETNKILRVSMLNIVLKTKAAATLIDPKHGISRIVAKGMPILDSNGNLKYAFGVNKSVDYIKEIEQMMPKDDSDPIVIMHDNERIVENNPIGPSSAEPEVFGKNPYFKSLYETMPHIANIDVPILVLGETGVGKDYLANYIHSSSSRKDKPFIKINCSAIPGDLLESELFGYEPGAFTGAASKGKIGMFELAENGTLYLDEIGEMNYDLQSKLLMVLQDKKMYKIGGRTPIPVRARIIAATNIDIEENIRQKKFRVDLYYRLNVISFNIPPLRKRKEDIPDFINKFLSDFNNKYSKNISISPEAYSEMIKYAWPGNIRELKNLIERLVIISKTNLVDKDAILKQLNIPGREKIEEHPFVADEGKTLKEKLEAYEAAVLKKALSGNATLSDTALRLDIDLSTLVRKKKKYNL